MEGKMASKRFNLSKLKKDSYTVKDLKDGLYRGIDVKRFITLIQAKVFMDWKGQNEFVEWLKKISGEDLK